MESAESNWGYSSESAIRRKVFNPQVAIKREYNKITDIDELITELSSSILTSSSDNQQINDAINKRKQQLEELRNLRAKAYEKQQEEEKRKTEELELAKLKSENDVIDEIIRKIRQG